jgi:DNA polymerase I-like protein with 3'-5' exonuclease and polymerase domains
MVPFPNIFDAKFFTIDVETYDPNLKKLGPGWSRDDGRIVGVAISAGYDRQWYFPLSHEVATQDNIKEQENFWRWLKDVMKTNKPKIGANLIYDYGWLSEYGVKINGDLFDVQFSEALLSERDKVNLDDLAYKYLGHKKVTSKLYKWIHEHYGESKDPRKDIYRSPPKLVAPYAIGDVALPPCVLRKQIPLLQEQGLYDLFLRENAQIPILVHMRQNGVRIDLERAEDLKKKIDARAEYLEKLFRKKFGNENVRSNKQLKTLFDRHKVKYPITKKGNPSFNKTFLSSCEHPVAQGIIDIRQLYHIKDTFIQSYLIDKNVNGRIHCSFHPLKDDQYGTRYGRYSASHPNLQNIPFRDPIWGPIIRGLFLPELNTFWVKIDLSQIEYRFLAHFAIGKSGILVRRQYNRDASTDYHSLVQNMIKRVTGQWIERPHTKNINFGGIYGMGEAKLCRQLGISRKTGHILFEAYHAGAPFARDTLNYYSELAQKQGYVVTILGRRARYDYWEDASTRDSKPMSYDQAFEKYGWIKRARTYTALNRVLQGSAADYLKEVTLQCYEQGLFEKYTYPSLTVHDELDFSLEDKRAIKEIKYVFEHAIKLKVPVLADVKMGESWGLCG